LTPVPAEEPWNTTRETALILVVQQAIQHEDHQLTDQLTRRLLQESEARNRGPAWCFALLARAFLPDVEDRWRILDEALNLAATRGYVQPFLAGGRAVRDLLRAGLTQVSSALGRTYARSMLDLAGGDGTSEKGEGDMRLLEPLTDREREVLALLFQGKSNKEIARAMFVSVDTVKTHLRHIYEKLGVSDRNEAVRRARELGFDPDALG
jgi:LuxR family maltose regulon positive regulatory protein